MAVARVWETWATYASVSDMVAVDSVPEQRQNEREKTEAPQLWRCGAHYQEKLDERTLFIPWGGATDPETPPLPLFMSTPHTLWL